MKSFYSIFTALLCTTACVAIDYEDANDKDSFCEVGAPDDTFSGIYLGCGLGYDFIDNKYELTPDSGVVLNNVKKKKGSISTHAYNFYGILGFNGVFNRFWLAGVETELFIRCGGQTKHNNGVRIEHKNTYGFNFKLRGGYIFRPISILAYLGVAAERSISHIAILNNANTYSLNRSFGSYHPSLSLGIEKKMRNNWSARLELSYTIGIWDDTGKYFVENNTKVPFKAKSNKKAVKVMFCKYL